MGAQDRDSDLNRDWNLPEGFKPDPNGGAWFTSDPEQLYGKTDMSI